MSVESLHQNPNQSRVLLDEEEMLLTALLASHPSFDIVSQQIAHGRVIEMSDGGMGSVKFVATEERLLGAILIEGEYIDQDGVLVNIAISADNKGELYEIDIWKVDFSPLKQYPAPEFVMVRNK